MGSHDSAFILGYLPIAGGESVNMAEGLTTAAGGQPFTWPASSLFFCDGRLVQCSGSSMNNLIVTVLPVPTETTEDLITLRSAVILEEVEDIFDPDFHDVGFCPMSGRIVLPATLKSLQILDFLLPLDER